MNNKEWKNNNNNNNNIYVFHFALHLSLSDKPKKGERDGERAREREREREREGLGMDGGRRKHRKVTMEEVPWKERKKNEEQRYKTQTLSIFVVF